MNKCLFLMVCLTIVLSSCKMTLKDIVKEAEQATFVIYTYDEYGTPKGIGSGFFIDKEGTGITNYHVLDGAVKAVLKTSDEEKYEINQVIASDRKWDIAKFTIKNDKNKTFNYLKFSNKEIEKGDKVYNISSPMGLEASVSEGIVSSLRSDGQHGNIIQVTAPISSGSSGSALLNHDGKVFAVATFKYNQGESLNFGVAINEEKLDLLEENEFAKRNSKFNRKDNFIILNVPNSGDQNVVLNALEFKDDATIAYFSYTNLDMSADHMLIWTKLGEGDKGFLIHDLDNNKKYYITSSSIGTDKENGTSVPLASNYKFKVFFPPIKDIPSNIDIVEGYEPKSWQFRNICIDEYKDNWEIDMNAYQKEYAYSNMHEGHLADAENLFLAMLDEDPEDLQALNAMGIISFVLENYSNAEAYFTKAIEAHPNNSIGYLNRSQIYQLRGDNQSALRDLTQAVNNSAQPDDYYKRALLYIKLEEWEKAEKDLDKVIKTEDYKRTADPYAFRAICKMKQRKREAACKDIEIAYNLTNDKELEKTLQQMWNDCGCY
ncbi:trypsin-like peptidase domain-containing protein [Phocaeicola coprophilus]|uniref:trypsin-like peptidase domain-containing protein n=1 Tax=Phocaeicola coprophilus TaxID=387090 RepID=UPI003AABA9E0